MRKEKEPKDTKELVATGSPGDDISGILDRWKHDENRTVRRVKARDGREVLQVRLPLGIEQYEINGRPDGRRPEGRESWLSWYRHRARTLGPEFALNQSDCGRLQSEGILYYYRYLLFFQIGDYSLCARDTARNLRLLDFVGKHATSKEAADGLEQYRPYILRMNIISRTLRRVKDNGNLRAAINSLAKGIETIRNLPELEDSTVFEYERTRSIKSLEDLIRQFRSQIPSSKRDLLKQKMDEAVRREDYEKAALFRDQLKRMPPGSRS